ncbi:hypothetical protein K2173_016408 [Erythroxylum novogranatense]|uniref:Uncharacterized protein n=1 Tax=Erythroxylum novogranatense TaxID=1862640 RepID=A0AAV8SG67_9ROSI|nr:hypothetical protein K2173_016408 [Erythroxylum novogranatense]
MSFMALQHVCEGSTCGPSLIRESWHPIRTPMPIKAGQSSALTCLVLPNIINIVIAKICLRKAMTFGFTISQSWSDDKLQLQFISV